MHWKECVETLNNFGVANRFKIPPEDWGSFDCEDAVTINDVWGAICWFWTWPGDYLLTLIAEHEQLGSFFLMSGSTFVGHWLSTTIPFIILFFYIATPG